MLAAVHHRAAVAAKAVAAGQQTTQPYSTVNSETEYGVQNYQVHPCSWLLYCTTYELRALPIATSNGEGHPAHC